MALLVVNGTDRRIHLINQAHLFDGSERALCGAWGPFQFAESARYGCEPCPYCVASNVSAPVSHVEAS